MTTRRLPDLLLLGVCLLLAATIVRESAGRAPDSAPATAGIAAVSAARISSDPRPAMPALAALGSFTERPLFWASRRPPRRVAAAASGTVGLVLSGVIISPSEKYAILARTDGKPPLRARVGQEAAGWRMAAISPDHVVLRNGDRRLVLKLGGKTPTAGAAVAAAGPRPPIPAPFDHLWRKDTRWLPR